MQMKRTLTQLSVIAGMFLAAAPPGQAAAPLPYYNPCDDLTTVTVVDNGNKKWATYNRGTLNEPDYYFRHAPNGTGTSTVATGMLWTEELAFEAGKIYEISVDLCVWTTKPQTKGVIALYESPSESSASTTLLTVQPLPTKTTKGPLPNSKCYIKATASTPRYLSIANRGGGSYSWFMVDNISVREVDPEMPKAAENLKLTAGQNEKNVSVSFTLPKQNVAGEQLAKLQEVRLMRDKSVVKTWTNQTPGAPITYDDNVSTIGGHTYSVICSNNSEDGPAATETIEIGPDIASITPTLNTNYQLFLPDGETRFGRNCLASTTFVPGQGCVVKWEPTTPGEDGTVTYTVTRVRDGKVIVANTTETSVTDADAMSAEPGLYTYKITARKNDSDTDLYTSATLSTHLKIPFASVSSKNTFYEYTTIDNDHSMNNWGYSGSLDVTKFGYTERYAARIGDDYLITPGIDIEAGKTYRVDIYASSANIIPATVGMRLKAGKSNSVEGLDEVLIEGQIFEQMMARRYSVYYNPTESGQRFFGIIAYDPTETNASNDLGIYQIDIVEVDGGVPQAIDNVVVAYGSDPKKAQLKFNAPSKDVTGNDLTALTSIRVLKNGAAYKTISNPAPGSEQSVDIELNIGVQDFYEIIPATAAGDGLAESAEVMIIQPAYENNFDKKDDMTGFTILNPDMGTYTWGFQNQAARAYPGDTDHDDYLVSPPIYMEGGMFYKINFITYVGNSTGNTDHIELLLGDKPEVESLTTKVIKPYNVTAPRTSPVLLKEWFSVPESGVYYLAWHVTGTVKQQSEVFIDNIMISEALEPTRPNGVTDLTITPDPEGALTATVTFNLPKVDLAGNDIDGKIYRVHIYRDGSMIKDQYTLNPGDPYTYEDKNIPTGAHLYTVICDSKSKSPGREIDDVAWVGINRPDHVTFVEAVENPEKYGEVKITWGAPENDYEGFKLNTSDITYKVGRLVYDMKTGETSEVVYEEAFTGTEYTVPQVFNDPEKQDFCRFLVQPSTSAGKSPTTMLSKFVSVGKPYATPVKESFVQMLPKIAIMTERTGDGSPAQWGFNTKNPVTLVEPVDGDKGLALMEVMFREGGSRMYTGRINLDVNDPVVTFYVYNQSDDTRTDANTLAIEVREGNGEFVLVEKRSIDEWANGKRGWQKASVDLSAYAGKIIYLGFNAQSNIFVFTHLDAIRVGSPVENDMTILSMAHPKVYVGVDHEITVEVANMGSKTATNKAVKLMLDGNEVAVSEITSLEPGATTEVKFTQTIGTDGIGNHRYSAEVDTTGDEEPFNNSISGEPFTVLANDYPGVENLTATPDKESVKLEWQGPELPTEAVETCDDLEQYESWSTMETGVGDWTLIDMDHGAVGGFQSVELPNVPMYSEQSFYIFDSSMDPFPNDKNYRARSGNKMFASMFNTGGEWTRDILVSPRLCGKEQTIKFWARGHSDDYRENFTVTYSTTGNKQADLVNRFEQVQKLGGEWTEFTYTLPEGTTYFAIEHYSYGGYFLFVDDITFTPEGVESLKRTGFNVYREGERVNTTPLAEATWSDMEPSVGTTTYGVSAVYDRGESPVKNIDVVYTGLDNIYGRDITIGVDGNDIVIEGAEGLNVAVVTTTGMTLASRKATETTTRIPVGTGVYLVKAGSVTAKVAVK